MTAEPDPILEVRGLRKRFGEQQVLQDVSFRVLSGRTTCVVGPSGSGKSTLLRCINWLEAPDAGETYLRGQLYGARYAAGGQQLVMTEAELAPFRTRIAMVFQQFALWPHLTVIENVIESPVHVQGKPKGEVTERSMALLRKVGLGTQA